MKMGVIPLVVVAGLLVAGISGCSKNRGETENGSQPDLFWAATMGDATLAAELIQKGADVNQVDSHGRATPLGVAADSGSDVIVEMLIAHGADVNKECPLYYAASKNRVKIAKLLLDKGANPSAYQIDGVSSPVVAAVRGGHIDVLRLLVAAGADPTAVGSHTNPLLEAASEGHVDVVTFLLEKGAKVDSTNSEGETSLFIAAKSGDLTMVRLLLSKKARGDIRTNANATPLDVAKQKGHKDIVTLLSAAKESEQNHPH